jgi:glycosyltransferase involved in cell wall biosynthesis
VDLTPRLRLLFLLPFAPRAGARHGGARVTGQLIAALARRHDVAVLYLADDSEPPPDPELVENAAMVEPVPRDVSQVTLGTRARVKVGLLQGTPTWASELGSAEFARRVAELATEWRPDVVQLEFSVMGQYLPALEASAAARVLVEHDASLRDLREWTGPLGRVVGALDERAWRKFERRVVDGVEAVVVFTGRDRAAVEGLGGATPVHEIPFGVPLPEAALSAAGSTPPSVLFVGNFRHAANVDAALWLGRELFPPVRSALPDARLTIVGASPSAEVLALAGEGVSVPGKVPEIAPYMDQAAVVAAPIRDGGGMRVKVLEALAAGKAVVATPLAVEGLGVTSEEQLEIAASAEEFSRALERLLRDESRRRELAESARAWAREHLGWGEAIARYERLYAELTGR